jgi:hypothetical protein
MSSGMLRRVDHVRTDVSEELSVSFIRVTKIDELGTTLAVTSTLMKEGLSSSETSVLTTDTGRNIAESAILHSHCRENLKSYIALTAWTFYRRGIVSPVKYELGFYIPEDEIVHSHRSENFKSCIAVTGWTL